MHAAEIAVLLLESPDGDPHRPALFGFVGANTDLLLDHGKFEPVYEAAVAARADRLVKGDAEQIQLAVEGFLGEFTDETRIRRILARASEDEQPSVEALNLLELGGGTALNIVLDALAADQPEDLADSLRNFASERDVEQWAEILPSRAAKGWPSLKPVFPVLRTMPRDASVPMLLKLLPHEESHVRREALISLCEVDDRSSAQRYLARALEDKSVRVVSTAVRRLGTHGTPEALELLGSYLAGDLEGTELIVDSCGLAAKLLAEHGEAGCHQLCEALEALRGSAQPGKAKLARLLAEQLERRSDLPEVSEALKRWRFSPSWLVSRLMRKQRVAEGASGA
jgi:hypothetical protein